jgi:outer membrane protein assembly factor BamB
VQGSKFVFITDCNADGIEDLVLIQPPKAGGVFSKQLGIFAYDGRSGTLLWNSNLTKDYPLGSCDLVGHFLFYRKYNSEVGAFDLRTGRLRDDATVLSKPSLLEDQDGIPFLYGRATSQGTEVLAFDSKLTPLRPYRAAYEWIPEGGSAVRRFILDKDFPATFGPNKAILVTKEKILCLDRANGKTLWERSREGTGRITGGATDDSLFVYYASSPWKVHALSCDSGAEVWSQDLPGRLPARDAFGSPPVLGAEAVACYQGGGHGVGIYSRKEGRLLRTIEATEPVVLSPMRKLEGFLVRENHRTRCFQFSSEKPLWEAGFHKIEVNLVGRTVVLISRKDNRVAGLDRVSGEHLWEREIQMVQGKWFPITRPSKVYYTLDNSRVFVFGKNQLTALDARSGEVIEQKPYSEWKSLILDTDRGNLIQTDTDGSLSCRAVGSNGAATKVPGVNLPEFSKLYLGTKMIFVVGGKVIQAFTYPCPSTIQLQPVEEFDGLVDYSDTYQILVEYLSTT